MIPFPDITTTRGMAEIALQLHRSFRLPDVTQMRISDFFATIKTQYQESLSTLPQDEIFQIYSVLAWKDSAFPVFELTHSLCAALLLTDPADVNSDDIQLPFSCFVLRVPDKMLSIQGRMGDRQNVSFILIHQFRATENEKRIVVRAIGRVSDMNDINLRTSAYEVLPTPKPGPVSDWLTTDLPVSPFSERQEVEADRSTMIAIRRLVINACLYITANGKGEHRDLPPRSRKKKARKHDPGPALDTWILGKEVKLDSDLLESARAWTQAASSDNTTAWRLRSKFTVRGHWRNQPHGPGRSLRRRKWIAPYWKGEGPTKISHLYKASDS